MLVLMLPRVSSRVSGFPVASPCLWGKLQNITCSKVSKPQAGCHVVLRGRHGTSWHSNLFDNVSKLVLCGRRKTFCVVFTRWVAVSVAGAAFWRSLSSFCMAGAELQTCRTACSTLHTPLSPLYTPHFTLHTPHFTFHTFNSTLYTLHSTLHTLHFRLRTLHSRLYTLHSTLHTLHFTLHTPHFTL